MFMFGKCRVRLRFGYFVDGTGMTFPWWHLGLGSVWFFMV